MKNKVIIVSFKLIYNILLKRNTNYTIQVKTEKLHIIVYVLSKCSTYFEFNLKELFTFVKENDNNPEVARIAAKIIYILACKKIENYQIKGR